MGALLGGGSQKTTQPAYTSLQLQTSSYGLPITILYGTNRISGNLLWYAGFKATAQTQSQGKGGSFKTTSYDYTVNVIYGLCEGTIGTVISMWKSQTRSS